MKTNQTKEFSETFDGFKGLDVSSPIGSGRLSRLRNFKLLPDGSAIKRGGFRYLASLGGEPRGKISYSDGGEDVILAAVGNQLVRVSLGSGSIDSAEIFSESEGRVEFFELRGRLYIAENGTFYRYAGGVSVEPCEPYVPFYGKDWAVNSEFVGEVNEPFNLLTSKIRITYSSSVDQVLRLKVGFPIKSIDAVYRNGVRVENVNFTVGTDRKRIMCDGFVGCIGAEVEVFVTLDTEEYLDSGLCGCDRAAVFDSFENSRVFMYGGEDSGRFYVSPAVSEDNLVSQAQVYGGADPIYFHKGGAFSFGGMDSISGMCRVFDRMVIFSNHRSWVTSSLCDDDGSSRLGVIVDVLSETTGCTSEDAFRMIGGATPVTVSRGGIYKWSMDPEFEEESVLTKISDKVSAHVDEGFLKNALVCYNHDGNELWFGNSKSEKGEVLVYNCENGAWWLYDGIFADCFFETGVGIAFLKGVDIYVFDVEAVRDLLKDGERDIEGEIESAGFDFSHTALKKHVVGANLLCELDGGRIALTLNDGRELGAADVDKSSASPLHVGADLFELRFRTGRTERVKFNLRAAGQSRQRVFGIEFFAEA